MKLGRLAEFFLAVWVMVLITHFWLERERILRDQLKTELRMKSLETKVDSLEVAVLILKEEVEKMNYIDLPEEIYFCEERVPLEDPLVRRKLEDEIFSATKFRANRWRIDMYLSEAQFYFPQWETGLAQDSLPFDLKYVAVIESEFNHHALSRAGAAGDWQMIRTTAIMRGLMVGVYVDDRYDPDSSFVAAREELKSLYERFDKWLLALAGYNAGPEKVTEVLLAQQQADSSYFHLWFPAEETRLYVYRLLTLKVLMENYQVYGFRDPVYTSRDVEMITYLVTRKSNGNFQTITEVATELGVKVPTFKYLNPRFIKNEIPPGRYILKTPKKKM